MTINSIQLGEVDENDPYDRLGSAWAQRGYADAFNGIGYPPEYERLEDYLQANYEHGRLTALELERRGIMLPWFIGDFWPESIDQVIDYIDQISPYAIVPSRETHLPPDDDTHMQAA